MSYAICDQQRVQVHPRSLISTFVPHCLDSIMPLVSIPEISRLKLVAVAEQTGLSHTWSKMFEDRFSCNAAQIIVNSHLWDINNLSRDMTKQTK